VSRVGGGVLALEADAESLRFATWGQDPQLWTYALPGGPTLRSRASRRHGDGLPMVVLDEQTGKLERVEGFVFSPPWSLTSMQTGAGHQVELTAKGRQPRARFLFEGEARVRVRFSAGELLLFDTTGRLVRVDLMQGVARRVSVQ
jgi:hypothetical protein